MSTPKILTILGVIVGLAFGIGIVGGVLRKNAADSNPMTAALRAELERQGHMDVFEARMKGLTDPAEARRVGAELSRKGVARLNPAQLIVRGQVLLRLDSTVGDVLCSKRFMGTLSPEEMTRYFGTLDSVGLADWSRLSAAAIGAELRATADIPPPNQEELSVAIQTIQQHMNEGDASRFGGVLSDPPSAPVADQCWAQMAMTRTMLTMPEPPQAEVMRTVAKLEAGL